MAAEREGKRARGRPPARSDGHLPPHDYEWVLFDFDGTLRHNEPDGLEVFADYAMEYGLAIDEDRRRAARRWNMTYWASSDQLKEDARKAGEDRAQLYLLYAQRHLRVLGAPEDEIEGMATALHRRMREEYEPSDHVPGDVLPTLVELRERGFRLGLLTNRQELPADSLEELGLGDRFEFALAAGETEWWKPDPRLFQYALEQVGGRAADSLYVGDNPYADVEGARAAGVQPVLVDPDELFPGVGCPSIRRVGQLPSLLAEAAA